MNDNTRPAALERVEGMIERLRERVPSLTTGIVLAIFAIGLAGGALASKPVHRWQINKEWRARIAAESATVRAALNQGDREAADADEKIIATLGDTDARLSQALAALNAASQKPVNPGECRIPASGLR